MKCIKLFTNLNKFKNLNFSYLLYFFNEEEIYTITSYKIKNDNFIKIKFMKKFIFILIKINTLLNSYSHKDLNNLIFESK